MSKADAIFEKVQSLPESTQSAMLQMLESFSRDDEGTKSQPGQALQETFRKLANTWLRETAYFSFMQQRALHPAYQRIIGMGWAVVPLLLAELQKKPDHWFWALRAITGAEPAHGIENMKSATDAWVNWGRQHGLLANGRG